MLLSALKQRDERVKAVKAVITVLQVLLPTRFIKPVINPSKTHPQFRDKFWERKVI